MVALTCLFVILWAGIGNGIHKNFEAPIPVHISGLVHDSLVFTTDMFWLVLVLDWT